MLLPFSLSASPAGQLLYLILRVSLVKSAFLTKSGHDDAHLTKLDRLPVVSASSQPGGQLLYLIPSRSACQIGRCDCFCRLQQHSFTAVRSGIPS